MNWKYAERIFCDVRRGEQHLHGYNDMAEHESAESGSDCSAAAVRKYG